MSDKPKTDEPRNQRNEPIGIRLVKFAREIDIPGKQFTSSVTADPKRPEHQSHWEIQYMPWLRHHKITWHEAGGRLPRAVFVHECHVASWEAL